MAFLAPAVEARVADVEVAGAVHGISGRDGVRLQPGERNRHLERRAGRIDAGDRAIEQRRAPVACPRGPLRLRDAGIEHRRVEGGIGAHRQHLAVAAVEHHGGGALVAEPAEHSLLQAGVERQAKFLALLAFLTVQLADHTAECIHLELNRARGAAQVEVARLLEAGAPDPDARQRQLRIAGDILLRWRRHVAHDVRQVIAVGVLARGADVDHDAGQIGGVDLDRRHLVPAEELAHHDGNEPSVAVHLAFDASTLVLGERHDAAEIVQRGGYVGGLLGDQQRPPVQLVAGNHGAGAVQHAPARRGDQAGADPVLLGQRGVAAAILHLHLVQASREHAECGDLCAHHQQGAAGEHAGPAGFAQHQARSGSATVRWARMHRVASAG